MTDDLERRLRRMYTTVSDRTGVADAAHLTSPDVPEHVVQPTAPRARRRTARALALAAAFVGMVAGLVVLGERNADAPADPEASGGLRHVLPTAAPRLLRAGETVEPTTPDRALPLSQLTTGPDGDVLTYAWDRGGVTIETRQRHSLALGDGIDVTVRDDIVAVAQESPTEARLTWADDHGIVVTISTFGEQEPDVDELARLADGLVFVDDQVWARASAFAGFSRAETLGDLGGGWKLDGSLQSESGIAVRRDGYGFGAAVDTRDACWVYVAGEARDSWFVVTSGRLAGRRPTLPDGSVIEPLRALAGTNLAVGDFSFPAADGSTPDVSCEGLE